MTTTFQLAAHHAIDIIMEAANRRGLGGVHTEPVFYRKDDGSLGRQSGAKLPVGNFAVWVTADGNGRIAVELYTQRDGKRGELCQAAVLDMIPVAVGADLVASMARHALAVSA